MSFIHRWSTAVLCVLCVPVENELCTVSDVSCGVRVGSWGVLENRCTVLSVEKSVELCMYPSYFLFSCVVLVEMLVHIFILAHIFILEINTVYSDKRSKSNQYPDTNYQLSEDYWLFTRFVCSWQELCLFSFAPRCRASACFIGRLVFIARCSRVHFAWLSQFKWVFHARSNFSSLPTHVCISFRSWSASKKVTVLPRRSVPSSTSSAPPWLKMASSSSSTKQFGTFCLSSSLSEVDIFRLFGE